VISDVVWFLLSGVCHQHPGHSLVVGGQSLPLCARCTGTFLGVPAGLLALWATGEGRRSGLPRGRVWWGLAFAVVAWALDGVNSFAAEVTGHAWLYAPSNAVRLATGTALGLVLAALLYPTIHYTLGCEARDEPVLSEPRHLLALPLAGCVLLAALYVVPGVSPGLAAGVLFAATASVLALVNGMVIVLLLHKEGTAIDWLGAAPYAIAGLAAALAEMGALALVRRVIVG